MTTFTPFTQMTSSQLLDNNLSQNSYQIQPELILDTPMSQSPSDSGFDNLYSGSLPLEETGPYPDEETIRETPKDPRKRKASNAEPSAPKKKPAPKKQASTKTVLFNNENKENSDPQQQQQQQVDKQTSEKMTLSQLVTAYEEISRFSANFGRLIVVTRDTTRNYCQLNVIG